MVATAVCVTEDVENVLLAGLVIASASATAVMPAGDVMPATTPSVAKLRLCVPPAAMLDNTSVWLAPSLDRVRVTSPGLVLVNVYVWLSGCAPETFRLDTPPV